MMHSSISEDHGIAALREIDRLIYSVGISTAGSAEMRMVALDPQRRVIASTIDREGALFVQKKIDEKGLSKQIEVRVEDVSAPLPYPDAFFDFVYARLVLHYLTRSDLTNALKELHRILKKGGKIFVVVRSTLCQEASDKNAHLDLESGMTTYFSDGNSYKRFFHTEKSIIDFLQAAGFLIKSANSYKEKLFIDFHRRELSKHEDHLIEIIAVR